MAQYWLEIASAADLDQLGVVTTGTLSYTTDGGIPVAVFNKTTAYGEYVRLLSVPSSSTIEVRCLLRQTAGGLGSSRVGPAVRISGDSAYVYGKNTSTTYKLGKRADGVSAELGANVTGQPAGNTWSWLETRIEGTTLTARSWEIGGSRPESATRTVTDTSISNGFAGFGGVFNDASDANLRIIAVGTDGDPAPTGPVGERQRSRLILTPW